MSSKVRPKSERMVSKVQQRRKMGPTHVDPKQHLGKHGMDHKRRPPGRQKRKGERESKATQAFRFTICTDIGNPKIAGKCSRISKGYKRL